ncbi:hypothetical protein E4U57_001224 [Claviceps arundinis]|uniref:Histidine kinase group protein n=1 Tax=Claviceps arundinis TaxID=1623583 RepID=A0ABQ7PB62_9HYPO|nr:hypothetical protein E4U57_001224 [Claviceps arundinis]
MAKNGEKRAPKAATVRGEGDSKSAASGASTSSIPSTPKVPRSDKNHASSDSNEKLAIARNKHWRFISSFHGAWINLPLEILEIVANLNYSTPRPQPMDPAVVFDVLKVRRNVDEATTFAVGAANDVASSTLINVNGGLPLLNSLGHGAKLSKERKLRMRELACHKLARAYMLDEIASSVASMQGTSALDNVGGLVLQRKRDNFDAKYCHFFLEKIPSRQLVSSTSLAPLNEMLSTGHARIEVLRTSSTVKFFQEDWDGAIQDLTEALRLARYRDLPHSFSQDTGTSSRPKAEGRPKFRNPNSVLSDDEQPTGLIQQLLFQRAAVFLTQACRFVSRCFPSTTAEGKESEEASKIRQEYRKQVKLVARRALKDYMSFLSHFDYSPNIPTLFMVEFHSDIAIASKQVKSSSVGYSPLSEDHIVYSVPELFAAVPPPHLPEYPTPATGVAPEMASSQELVTYHPLLTEALHATLLCHSLLQTSVKELQRHAYMVARLVRLCHGEPIFRESRSVSRTDWVEVLRRADNWIHLCDTWEALCAPAPSYHHHQRKQQQLRLRQQQQQELQAKCQQLQQQQQQQRQQQQADPASATASPSQKGDSPAASGAKAQSTATSSGKTPLHGMIPSGAHVLHSPEDIFSEGPKDFPYSTGRSTSIALWISNAPVVTGVTRRRKKVKKAGGEENGAGLAAAMEEMTLGGGAGEEQNKELGNGQDQEQDRDEE